MGDTLTGRREVTRHTMTVEQARRFVVDLQRAIDEAVDHETTMSAVCHEANVAVHVNPHKRGVTK